MPQVGDGQERRAQREAGEGWLELERLGNIRMDFLPTLLPSLIRLGSNLVKNTRCMGVGAEEVGRWVGGMGVCVCV